MKKRRLAQSPAIGAIVLRWQNQIDALLSTDPTAAGPFWCASPAAAYRNRPPEPFQTAQSYVVKGLRLTDKRARSGSPFRLFGTASVGIQSLTGIAHLHRLRNDPKLAVVSLFGLLRPVGRLKRSGFGNTFRSCTPRFTLAFETQWPTKLQTAARSVRCGSGRATWIATIFCGASFVGQSK